MNPTMEIANLEEHVRAFLVGALVMWLGLDFASKRRVKETEKTKNDQNLPD